MIWPWHKVYSWGPFKIDALGLVTLLGADEVNASLGRLVPSRYVEYFPYLGVNIVAGDRFKEKKPAFNLYNFTDGIYTTDLAGWMSRWMLAQQFEENRSVVCFHVSGKPKSEYWGDRILGGVMAFVCMGFAFAMTLLSGDWYGFANATAMAIGILVRSYILEANRRAIDRRVMEMDGKLTGKRPKHNKCVVVMSDSKAVTLLIPGHLVPVFIKNPVPADEWTYHTVRWIGWAAMAVHVLSIGMTQLANQIYAVVLIVVPTVLMYWKLGCDDSKWYKKWKKIWGIEIKADYHCWIGTKLVAQVVEWPEDFDFTKDADEGFLPSGFVADEKQEWHRQRLTTTRAPFKRKNRRQDLYAWLSLTLEEEHSLGKWDLLPHQRHSSPTWWQDYTAKKALITRSRDFLGDLVRDGPTHGATKTANPHENNDDPANRTFPLQARSTDDSDFTLRGLRKSPTATTLTSEGMVVDLPPGSKENPRSPGQTTMSPSMRGI